MNDGLGVLWACRPGFIRGSDVWWSLVVIVKC